MQLECALFFITVVVGMACAIIAALSWWHSPELKPHEKLLLSNCKCL